MYEEAAKLGLSADVKLLVAVVTDPSKREKGAAENELQIYLYSVAVQSLELVFST